MAVEQQLVDYIKKARDAGQPDNQTGDLLVKNGWTVPEIKDAFAVLNQPQQSAPAQPKVEAKPQPQVQPQAQAKPVAQPQPQVQAQAKPVAQPQSIQQPAQNMGRARKSHAGIKILIILVIIVILAGAGLFVAGQYLNLPWNPFWPNPAIVINQMSVAVGKLKSYNTTIQGQVVATQNSAALANMSFNIKAKSDTGATINSKGDAAISFSVTVPGSTSPIVSADVNTIGINGTMYLKINSLTIPQSSFAGLDVSQFQGKFFQVDQTSIIALSQAGVGGLSQINISQTDVPALIKSLQNLVLTDNVFSVVKQLPDEVNGGQNTYHYLVKVSSAKIKDLINAVSPTSIADSVGDVNVEMWVGKNDSMLYEAKIDKTIDLTRVLPSTPVQVELKLDMVNSNFNQPVVEQVPTGVQKVEDVLLPLLRVQKIKSDMSQVAAVAETVFGTSKSYSTLCRNGLLSGYLKMGLLGFSADMVSQGATTPVCFADAQNYCVSTQISDGTLLCVGAANVSGTTKCISSRTICK